MKQQWSTSKEKLVTLEEGGRSEDGESSISTTSNFSSRMIQYMKLILYLEVILLIGWCGYALLQMHNTGPLKDESGPLRPFASISASEKEFLTDGNVLPELTDYLTTTVADIPVPTSPSDRPSSSNDEVISSVDTTTQIPAYISELNVLPTTNFANDENFISKNSYWSTEPPVVTALDEVTETEETENLDVTTEKKPLSNENFAASQEEVLVLTFPLFWAIESGVVEQRKESSKEVTEDNTKSSKTFQILKESKDAHNLEKAESLSVVTEFPPVESSEYDSDAEDHRPSEETLSEDKSTSKFDGRIVYLKNLSEEQQRSNELKMIQELSNSEFWGLLRAMYGEDVEGMPSWKDGTDVEGISDTEYRMLLQAEIGRRESLNEMLRPLRPWVPRQVSEEDEVTVDSTRDSDRIVFPEEKAEIENNDSSKVVKENALVSKYPNLDDANFKDPWSDVGNVDEPFWQWFNAHRVPEDDEPTDDSAGDSDPIIFPEKKEEIENNDSSEVAINDALVIEDRNFDDGIFEDPWGNLEYEDEPFWQWFNAHQVPEDDEPTNDSVGDTDLMSFAEEQREVENDYGQYNDRIISSDENDEIENNESRVSDDNTMTTETVQNSDTTNDDGKVEADYEYDENPRQFGAFWIPTLQRDNDRAKVSEEEKINSPPDYFEPGVYRNWPQVIERNTESEPTNEPVQSTENVQKNPRIDLKDDYPDYFLVDEPFYSSIENESFHNKQTHDEKKKKSHISSNVVERYDESYPLSCIIRIRESTVEFINCNLNGRQQIDLSEVYASKNTNNANNNSQNDELSDKVENSKEAHDEMYDSPSYEGSLEDLYDYSDPTDSTGEPPSNLDVQEQQESEVAQDVGTIKLEDTSESSLENGPTQREPVQNSDAYWRSYDHSAEQLETMTKLDTSDDIAVKQSVEEGANSDTNDATIEEVVPKSAPNGLLNTLSHGLTSEVPMPNEYYLGIIPYSIWSNRDIDARKKAVENFIRSKCRELAPASPLAYELCETELTKQWRQREWSHENRLFLGTLYG